MKDLALKPGSTLNIWYIWPVQDPDRADKDGASRKDVPPVMLSWVVHVQIYQRPSQTMHLHTVLKQQQERILYFSATERDSTMNLAMHSKYNGLSGALSTYKNLVRRGQGTY